MDLNPLEKQKFSERKIQPEEPKKGIFSELSSLFRSFSKLITDSTVVGHHPGGHSIVLAKRDDLVANAHKMAEDLTKLKNDFFKEFGAPFYSVISKTLAPVIEQAKALGHELQKQKEGGQIQTDFAHQAIQSTEIWLQFCDEKKLKKKIISDAIQATRSVIEKDMQVLRHYQIHALQDADLASDEFISRLEVSLEPIFQQFHELVLSKITTDDLRQFFHLRAAIDEKRSVLTEQGLHIIDHFIENQRVEKPVPEEDVSAEPQEAEWPS